MRNLLNLLFSKISPAFRASLKIEEQIKDLRNEVKDLKASQESFSHIWDNQFSNLDGSVGRFQKELEDQRTEFQNLLKDFRECQEIDLNIIFKYISKGLELHPYKGYLHRIIAADYHSAKINHYVRYKYASGFVKDDSDILDIACGVGYGSSLLAHESRAHQILSVDFSAETIDFAERVFKHDKIKFMQGNCLNPSLFEDSQFSLIVSFETIEHIKDDFALLQNYYRWLKKNGILIGSVPNQDVYPFNREEHLYHYKHYTRDMLAELLCKTGFDIEFIGYGGWEKVPVTEPDYSHIFIAKKTR
jgi:2-polyprenyl-3-methyl-5-hydroxy-6-metoxy-1,4-benzoquinol methylase